MLVTHTELKLEIERIKKKIDNSDKNIEIVFRYFDELLEKKETRYQGRVEGKDKDVLDQIHDTGSVSSLYQSRSNSAPNCR